MKGRTLIHRVGVMLIGLTFSAGANVAMPDVVAVVSAKNPVSTLSKTQTVDIFLGKASRFPDGRQAVPVDQVEGSSARDEFYARLAGKSPAQLKAHWSKIIFTGRGRPPVEVQNSVEVKEYVAAHPNAIGYIERGAIDSSVKVLLTN